MSRSTDRSGGGNSQSAPQNPYGRSTSSQDSSCGSTSQTTSKKNKEQNARATIEKKTRQGSLRGSNNNSPGSNYDSRMTSKPPSRKNGQLTNSRDLANQPRYPPWKQRHELPAGQTGSKSEEMWRTRGSMKLVRGDSGTDPPPQARRSSSNGVSESNERDLCRLDTGHGPLETASELAHEFTKAEGTDYTTFAPLGATINRSSLEDMPSRGTSPPAHTGMHMESLIDIPPQQSLNNPVRDISGRWSCSNSECVNRDRPEFTGLCYRDTGENSGHIMVVPEALIAWIAAARKDEGSVELPDEQLKGLILEGEATAYTNEIVTTSKLDFALENSKQDSRYQIPAREELRRFFAWLKSRNPNEDFTRTEEFLGQEQCDVNGIRGDFSFELWRELGLPLGLWGRLRREAKVFQKLCGPTLKEDDALNTVEKQAIRKAEAEEVVGKSWALKKKEKKKFMKCTKCSKEGHYAKMCLSESKCLKCGKFGHPTEWCWRVDIDEGMSRAEKSLGCD